MSNGLVSVDVAEDGTLGLVAADGTAATGVGRIVDGGDAGDSYNYGPPVDDTIVDHPTAVRVDADLRGPVRGRIRVSRTYAWPRGLGATATSRTAETVPTEVVMEAELRAGEPFVRIAVAFDNHADDHRVRFEAPLPRRADRSFAEGQFAVVERGLSAEGGYREEPLPTFPAHGWVDAGGLAVLLEHLAEYELVDEGATVALTVLRSTGLISRNAHPYRQDPAGPEMAIPAAQMHGHRRMSFGLLPHPGDWTEGAVAGAAERYRHDGVVAFGTGPPAVAWPPPGAGADAWLVDGADVALSALRRRDGEWIEARVVNLAGQPRTATIGPGLLEARAASLRGEPGQAMPVEGGRVRLDLRPAEIRTIQVRRRETAAGRADVLDAAGPRQNA
jgi:alpha-mannosidase